MSRYLSIIGLAFLTLAACSREEINDVPESVSPIIIRPSYMSNMHVVEGELMQTKSAPEMVDFPVESDSPYGKPISMFGFFLEDEKTAGEDSKGCFGETREDILSHLTTSPTISNQHAADVLQQRVNEVSPAKTYTSFMNNAQYVYSSSAAAYISNDIAAFWRPDAYHYLLCYAPPLDDASLETPLEVTLHTNADGIQDDPDFNFLYGRRVLLYNSSNTKDSYHKSSVEIKLMPMLSRLNLHLKCSPKLKGMSVFLGIRVKTYKTAKFHLDTGRWTIDDPEDYQTITRYFNDDYLIPEEWEDGNKFTLSLFPNIENPSDEITSETLTIIKSLDVCINNTWVSVVDLEETDAIDGGNHLSDVVPLAPGYKTDVYITISSKNGIEDWNNLLITFSNWKIDDTYEYAGILE